VPLFVYAGYKFDSAYPDEGMFRGEVIVKVLRHIYISPEMALIDPTMDSFSLVGSNAEALNIFKITGYHVAYALANILQARHMMSDQDRWTSHDGAFAYSRLFYTALNWFSYAEDDPLVEETLNWLNMYVLAHL
ncbi:hypothetical protein FA95DRAFT_1505862, partial [Auriscalpium vulgare]